MAPPTPLLAVRGSEGLYMVNGPPSFTESAAFQRDSGKNCKAVAFSKDGSLFAWCNGEKVNVVNVTRAELLHSFDFPKTVCLEFSPKNNVLATWQGYATAKDGTAGVPNLQLHDLRTGKCLKSFVQKKMQNWCPCWADDESICARNVNNEVHFFENNNFNTIANKLHLQKVSDFVLSPGAQPTKVAVYVPGSKGAPSFVRLYQYPNFGGPQSALANKSFFKADKVTMLWNKKAFRKNPVQKRITPALPHKQPVGTPSGAGFALSGAAVSSSCAALTVSVPSHGRAGGCQHRGGQERRLVLRRADPALRGGQRGERRGAAA